MNSNNKLIVWTLFVLILVAFSTEKLYCQDSTQVSADTSQTKQVTSVQVDEEIVLSEITIEAEIEKPRVSIFPKRIEPELGEMEFIDRSFENELKKAPDKPFILKERSKSTININELKKKIKNTEK